MSVSTFDQIAQEIVKQQYLMEALAAENRNLRRQIADLRAGRGIQIELCGTIITLKDDESTPITHRTDLKQMQTVPSPLQTISQTPPDSLTAEITAKTAAITPAQAIAPSAQEVANQTEQKPASFLEEIMVDEFSAAMTRPTAIWTGSLQKPEEIDEKQKAILRRELMGSFLLE